MKNENPVYIVTHWSIRGGRHTFETDKDVWNIVNKLEDMWDYVMVEDKERNIIYETKGLDDFLKKLRRGK